MQYCRAAKQVPQVPLESSTPNCCGALHLTIPWNHTAGEFQSQQFAMLFSYVAVLLQCNIQGSPDYVPWGLFHHAIPHRIHSHGNTNPSFPAVCLVKHLAAAVLLTKSVLKASCRLYMRVHPLALTHNVKVHSWALCNLFSCREATI